MSTDGALTPGSPLGELGHCRVGFRLSCHPGEVLLPRVVSQTPGSSGWFWASLHLVPADCLCREGPCCSPTPCPDPQTGPEGRKELEHLGSHRHFPAGQGSNCKAYGRLVMGWFIGWRRLAARRRLWNMFNARDKGSLPLLFTLNCVFEGPCGHRAPCCPSVLFLTLLLSGIGRVRRILTGVCFHRVTQAKALSLAQHLSSPFIYAPEAAIRKELGKIARKGKK